MMPRHELGKIGQSRAIELRGPSPLDECSLIVSASWTNFPLSNVYMVAPTAHRSVRLGRRLADRRDLLGRHEAGVPRSDPIA